MRTIKIRTYDYLSDELQIVAQRITKTLFVDGREFAIMRSPLSKRGYWICVDVKTGVQIPNAAIADREGRSPSTAKDTLRKAEAWLTGRVNAVPWDRIPEIN